MSIYLACSIIKILVKMKKTKNFLLLFLIFHLFSTLVINFSGYSYFSVDSYQHRLNRFGKVIVNEKAKLVDFEVTRPLLKFHSSLLGTNRGYSFFSPNVSNEYMNLVFMANGKQVDIPLSSYETALKFKTARFFFESNFKDNELRNTILKSFSKWYFTHYNEIDKIDVYFDFYKFKPLQDLEKNGYNVVNEKIHGYTINRKNKI